MSKTFKALEARENNGDYSLSIIEKSLSNLPENDLLIKVEYSSLNYKDAMSAKGMPGVTKNYPHTPGIDAAGEVAETSTKDFKEGDEVIVTGYDLGMNTSGGFAEYIRVPASWAIQLPEGLSSRKAMALGTAGLTAGLSIHALDYFREYAGLSELGSEVTAVSGKKDQSDFFTSLGASQILSREELLEVTRRPIGKSLWDVGVDVVSGDILSLLLTSLTPGGAVACSGLVGGASFESSIFPFILRGNALIGIDSVEIPLKDKLHIWEHFSQNWALDRLDDITKEVSLEELGAEIESILSGNQIGRVVVKT